MIQHPYTVAELTLQSERIRRRLVEIIYQAKAGHIGGGLSSLNILTALYFHTLHVCPEQPDMKGRDIFIMSKGHCCEALYAVLEARGFFKNERLDTLGQYLSPFGGHPTADLPGVEFSTGALGHGLPLGVGSALAARLNQSDAKTYVLMGDGEQGEGSIYEAAMAASHYHLDNLIAIIDRNGLQISADTEHVMALEPIADRWRAFGWDVLEAYGDDIEEVVQALDLAQRQHGKPHLLLMKTTKGYHVSLMENVLKWHHGVPNETEYRAALQEIDNRIANLQNAR